MYNIELSYPIIDIINRAIRQFKKDLPQHEKYKNVPQWFWEDLERAIDEVLIDD